MALAGEDGRTVARGSLTRTQGCQDIAEEQTQHTIPNRKAADHNAFEAPWVLFRFLYGAQDVSLGHMIVGFDFGRGLVVQGFMDSSGVPPVDPVHRFEFDLSS